MPGHSSGTTRGRRGRSCGRTKVFRFSLGRVYYNIYIMATKTLISIDEELQRRARRKAAELGVSFAEYVRTLVARDLRRRRRPADPSIVFGLGDSGGADVAREKDAMIGRAVAAERGRRRVRR